MLNKLSYKLIVYIIIFIICISILLYRVDSNYFYNLKKIELHNTDNFIIKDFDYIINLIDFDNSPSVLLSIQDKKMYLQIKGFEDILINSYNEDILKRNGLHSTQSLALFSLTFLYDYFLTNFHNHTLDSQVLDNIDNIYLFVYKEIDNKISLNSMTHNDHVVSDRINFLLLYLSYLKSFHPHKEKMINNLTNDFNLCLELLLNRDHFTWKTNHGIMQLRSLSYVASSINDVHLKQRILNEIDIRLKLIIPYFIGKDGAIYEAASGYWFYIFEQLSMIAKIEVLENLESTKLLKSRLELSRRFLEIVRTNDGFIQGVGDSYSKDSSLKPINMRTVNNIFSFSNGLCGLNYQFDSVNYQLLFVSLDTPPNVHKLPEDLAVYLYIQGPFFANTGTYSYGSSDIRHYMQDELSQSTVTFDDLSIGNPIRSQIRGIELSSACFAFEGIKEYLDGSKINRKVYLTGNSIKIEDYCAESKTICARFNIFPEVRLEVVNDSSVVLQNKSGYELLMSFNAPLTTENSIISDSYNSYERIERIVVKGQKILTKLTFIDIDCNELEFIEYKEADQFDWIPRDKAAKILANEFGERNNITLKKYIKKEIVFFVLAFSLIIILFEIYIKKREESIKNES